jgi:hypothetical protein
MRRIHLYGKMCLRQIKCDIVGWTQSVQDRVQWRALVNAIMSFSVP